MDTTPTADFAPRSPIARTLVRASALLVALLAGTAAAAPPQVEPGLVDGAAHLAIPIEGPPGARGIQPDLTLRYDSRADGNVAPGWSLELPRIERADARAPWQYDGEALLATHETRTDPFGCAAKRYVRAVDRYETILFCERASRWVVLDSAGTMRRFEPLANDDKAAFALHSVQDPHGLFWRARYEGAHLSRVEYTLRAHDGTVEALGPRRVLALEWTDGRLTAIDARLESESSPSRVRRYELARDAAGNLSELRIFGRSDSDALAPMRFTYDDGRLVHFDNGLGARTSLAWSTATPPVLQRIDTRTGVTGATISWVMRYAEPASDARRYGRVEVVRADSLGSAPTWQRFVFATGEPERRIVAAGPDGPLTIEDDTALAGAQIGVQSGPKPGVVLAETWTPLEVVPTQAGAVARQLSHVWQGAHDLQGEASAWQTRDLSYDDAGRVTRIREVKSFGEGIERFTAIEYAEAAGEPTDLPSRVQITAGPAGGVRVAEILTYYDDNETLGTLRLGDPTREVVRTFADGTPHDDVTERSFDDTGAEIVRVDPNGQRTNTAWTPSRVFPARIERLGDRPFFVEATWDEGLGLPLQVRRRGPPALTRRWTWDGLGRLRAVDGSADGPDGRSVPFQSRIDYLGGGERRFGQNRMREHRRDGDRRFFEETTYDGWARPVNVRHVDGGIESTFGVRYDHHGRITRLVTGSSAAPATPAPQQPVRFNGYADGNTQHESQQDWAGRPVFIRTTGPDGTPQVSSVRYDIGSTVVTDEDGQTWLIVTDGDGMVAVYGPDGKKWERWQSENPRRSDARPCSSSGHSSLDEIVDTLNELGSKIETPSLTYEDGRLRRVTLFVNGEIAAEMRVRHEDDPSFLLGQYRQIRSAMQHYNAWLEDIGEDAGDAVLELVGPSPVGVYFAARTSTAIQFGGGLVALGPNLILLPEAVWHSPEQFGYGMSELVDGVRTEDSDRAWMGVAHMSGATGTVFSAAALAGGGVRAASDPLGFDPVFDNALRSATESLAREQGGTGASTPATVDPVAPAVAAETTAADAAPVSGVHIAAQAGDLAHIVAQTPSGTVEVVAELAIIDGETLVLRNMSVEGPGANSLGPASVRALARDLGRQFDVQEVVIEGTRRTTGANPGHLPRSIRICVPPELPVDTPQLRSTSPIRIPADANVEPQLKNGYQQIRYRWNDSGMRYQARWHTRTPGAPEGQGDTWVIERRIPGNPKIQNSRRVEYYLHDPEEWISETDWDAAVTARRQGSATPEQQQLLDRGHHPVGGDS